ncbi:mannose-binding protein, partial [Streptomyces sp. NPDC050264]
MSAEPQAAAARAEETGPPAPEAETPSPAATEAEAKAEAGAEPTEAQNPAPEPAPATAPVEKTTAAPKESVAVAAAVATTPPGTRSVTGVDRGRPRKPVLAGAAIAGAALVAIPLLLIGSAGDDGQRDTAKNAAAAGDTVLNPESAPAALDDYVAEKPSASPHKKAPKKSPVPKVAATP